MPAKQETWVRSLHWEDPLEKGLATHSSILAWRIPWTVWVHKESGTTEWLTLFLFLQSIFCVCLDFSVKLFLKQYFPISFSRGSSWPRDRTQAFCVGKRVLYHGATRELKYKSSWYILGWKRKWQSTPVFLPGESRGQRSLVGYSPRGCKESDTTEVTYQACTSTHGVLGQIYALWYPAVPRPKNVVSTYWEEWLSWPKVALLINSHHHSKLQKLDDCLLNGGISSTPLGGHHNLAGLRAFSNGKGCLGSSCRCPPSQQPQPFLGLEGEGHSRE